MSVKIYNQEGKETGSMDLPSFFALPWNADLVHQVVESERANQRQVLAHAKNRAEVRGGGRKPWRQKGTGRARHGSIRSPIWIKGGKAHGPTKERNFKKDIPKKMRRKALLIVLAQKFRDNEIMFLSGLHLDSPKTKLAADVLKKLAIVKGFERLGGKGGKALILEDKKDISIERSFRNLPYARILQANNINPRVLLENKFIILSRASMEIINKTFATSRVSSGKSNLAKASKVGILSRVRK